MSVVRLRGRTAGDAGRGALAGGARRQRGRDAGAAAGADPLGGPGVGRPPGHPGRRGPRSVRTLLSVQYLRALAAVAVVVYHAFQWLPDGGFDVGRAGVDVFFVISGFIMWSITAGQPARPGAFLWRRLTRVAP